MATTLTSTGISFGQYTSTTRPTGISQGHIIYNTDRKGLEIYDGSNWVALENDAPFLYRQIIAYGYVYGGYKSSSPWTNVNKMTHSTDGCADLGNLLNMLVHMYQGSAIEITHFYLVAMAHGQAHQHKRRRSI